MCCFAFVIVSRCSTPSVNLLICFLLFVMCCVLLFVACVLFIFCCSLLVVSCLLFVVCCLLFDC